MWLSTIRLQNKTTLSKNLIDKYHLGRPKTREGYGCYKNSSKIFLLNVVPNPAAVIFTSIVTSKGTRSFKEKIILPCSSFYNVILKMENHD
jgi:hypothetical protein